LVDESGNIRENFVKDIIPANFTEDQTKALAQFFLRYKAEAERLAKGLKIADVTLGFGDFSAVEQTLSKLVEKTIEILDDPSILPGLRESAIANAINKLFEIPEKSVEDFKNTIDTTGEVGYAKWKEGIGTLINTLTEFGLVQAQQTQETQKNAVTILGLTQRLEEYNKAFSGSYQLTEQQIEKVTNLIVSKLKATPDLINEILVDLARKSGDIVERFGEDGVMKLLIQIG
jgi:hypothetical protein